MEFGLPLNLVEEALKAAEKSPSKNKRLRPKSFLDVVHLACLRLVGFLNTRPILCSVVVVFICSVIYKVAALTPESKILIGLLLFLFAVLFMIAINFIKGEARYAILTSAAAVPTLYITLISFEHILGRAKTPLHLDFFSAIFATLVLIPLLSLLNLMFAVIGGVWKLRQEEALERRLDRLSILQRVFDLQTKLSSGANVTRDSALRLWIRRLRKRWWIFALVSGIAYGLVTLIGGAFVGMPESQTTATAGQLAFSVLTTVVGAFLWPVSGFLASNFARGVLAGFILWLSVLVLQLLPIEPFGATKVLAEFSNPAPWVTLCVLLLASGLGGLGAYVEEKSYQKRKLDEADQAAVLSELVRLQRLLSQQSAEVFVLCVDCYQSRQMKENADRLAIELSFREWHDFISSIIVRHGGTVVARSGDDCIAEFQEAEHAFSAAREMQTRMPAFNKTSNRLRLPFRVRIGIHAGEVHGGLGDVEFTEVIDIAAHVQEAGTVGGIAVTEAVRAHLESVRFTELAERVDGQRVFLANLPTD